MLFQYYISERQLVESMSYCIQLPARISNEIDMPPIIVFPLLAGCNVVMILELTKLPETKSVLKKLQLQSEEDSQRLQSQKQSQIISTNEKEMYVTSCLSHCNFEFSVTSEIQPDLLSFLSVIPGIDMKGKKQLKYFEQTVINIKPKIQTEKVILQNRI